MSDLFTTSTIIKFTSGSGPVPPQPVPPEPIPPGPMPDPVNPVIVDPSSPIAATGESALIFFLIALAVCAMAFFVLRLKKSVFAGASVGSHVAKVNKFALSYKNIAIVSSVIISVIAIVCAVSVFSSKALAESNSKINIKATSDIEATIENDGNVTFANSTLKNMGFTDAYITSSNITVDPSIDLSAYNWEITNSEGTVLFEGKASTEDNLQSYIFNYKMVIPAGGEITLTYKIDQLDFITAAQLVDKEASLNFCFYEKTDRVIEMLGGNYSINGVESSGFVDFNPFVSSYDVYANPFFYFTHEEIDNAWIRMYASTQAGQEIVNEYYAGYLYPDTNLKFDYWLDFGSMHASLYIAPQQSWMWWRYKNTLDRLNEIGDPARYQLVYNTFVDFSTSNVEYSKLQLPDTTKKLWADNLGIEPSALDPDVVTPDCAYEFSFYWPSFSGENKISKGYFYTYNEDLPICCGGLYFGSDVNGDLVNTMAFYNYAWNSTYSDAVMGGAAAGSDVDLESLSYYDKLSFCNAFIDKLYGYLDLDRCVLGEGVTTDSETLSMLARAYFNKTWKFNNAILQGDNEFKYMIPGRASVDLVKNMLITKGDSFAGKNVLFEGFDEKSLNAVDNVLQLGGKALAIGDETGYIYDDQNGLILELLKEILANNESLKVYAEKISSANYVEGEAVYSKKADICFCMSSEMPCTEEGAKNLVANGAICVISSEPGTIMPTAVQAFQAAKILYSDFKSVYFSNAFNAWLEIQKNTGSHIYTPEEIDDMVIENVNKVHDGLVKYGTELDGYINYPKGFYGYAYSIMCERAL